MALTKIDDRGLKTPIDLLDNEKIRLGTGNDLELYHNGSETFIHDNGTGGLILRSNALRINNAANTENMIVADENGSVDLYYDNSKKLETTSAGATVTGALTVDNAGGNAILGQNLSLVDNGKVKLGTSDDLQIYHHNTNSFIENTEGALYISTVTGSVQVNKSSAENMAKFIVDGAVELYYDNTKKFETISTGVKVQSSAAHCHLKINSANSNSSVIHFGTAADDDMAQIWYDDYSDALYYRTSTNTPQIFYTNNAERMRIASGGQVLIGTTSTSGVSGSADDLIIGSIGDSTDRGITLATTTSGSIRWADAGDNAMGRIQYLNNSDVMTFHTSNAERMRIDSSGRVTKPAQPCFSVYNTTNADITWSGGDNFDFNAEHLDEGGNYNTSNKRFTAPVSGKYQFNFFTIIRGNDDNREIGITINGNSHKRILSSFSWQSGTSNYDYFSLSALVSLSANDYVHIKNMNSNKDITVHGAEYSSFSGFLVA